MARAQSKVKHGRTPGSRKAKRGQRRPAASRTAGRKGKGGNRPSSTSTSRAASRRQEQVAGGSEEDQRNRARRAGLGFRDDE